LQSNHFLGKPKPNILIDFTFIELDTINSTNNYAHQLIKQNLATNGTTIFAHNQTNGKGQMGKKWVSQKGNSITMSIIIDISSVTHNQFPVLAATSLGVFTFLQKKVTQKCSIKWPNDLYINDNKAGGILVEIVKDSKIKKKWAIVGIGINVNNKTFDNELANATSIFLHTNKKHNVMLLAKKLAATVLEFTVYLQPQNHVKLLDLYNKNLYKQNEIVKLKMQNVVFSCTILGVDNWGHLLVVNAPKDYFSFGEIVWI
jgi:BirA family transcriptional regulator, biotin operon repressor / biotin---[acetyl-CoA-carboxylase] ligase